MIYVDLRESVPSKYGKFHGGGNYSKRSVQLLKNTYDSLTIFIPTDFEPSSKKDKELLLDKKVTLIRVNSENEILLAEKNAILFIPLLPTKKFGIIDTIKKNNPNAKIFLTIHGTRYADSKYDPYDRYYYHGIKYTFYFLITYLSRFVGKIVYKKTFKTQIPKYDKIFTVSNDSLQKIVAMSQPKYIKPFYQGSNNFNEDPVQKTQKENFILFVNANRPEKNFLRTLEAFLQFKKQDTSNIKLYVTGIDDRTQDALLRYKKLDTKSLKQWVTFSDYLSDNDYNALFEKCKFLLYTSKTEGFGLPLLEACSKECSILSSWITATPEVLGSAVNYVNPYDVNSIADGINKMVNHSNLNQVAENIKQRKELCKKFIAQNDKEFVQEFKLI
ncbi:MAG: hypothetical protein BKP49_10565 [Treponema sp. CETP13]|nr:MAG: hypothetical protein BKP49_10565 [Treponema sp. CETP13]